MHIAALSLTWSFLFSYTYYSHAFRNPILAKTLCELWCSLLETFVEDCSFFLVFSIIVKEKFIDK